MNNFKQSGINIGYYYVIAISFVLLLLGLLIINPSKRTIEDELIKFDIYHTESICINTDNNNIKKITYIIDATVKFRCYLSDTTLIPQYKEFVTNDMRMKIKDGLRELYNNKDKDHNEIELIHTFDNVLPYLKINRIYTELIEVYKLTIDSTYNK